MSRIVYTYRSIEHIDDHPYFTKILQLPHITATSGLAAAMGMRYPEFSSVVDVHRLQSVIVSDWENESTAFQQFIDIGNIIRSMNVPEEIGPLHASFYKNRRDVLNAIRLLVEANVYPDQLRPANNEEQLFCAIWERFEALQTSPGRFRASMSVFQNAPATLAALLNNSFPGFDLDAVVLHGFYFITPIQERIFDMLEASGKTLIFLCCVDDRLPTIHQIWHDTFDPHYGFPAPEEWIPCPPVEEKNFPFGTTYEGHSSADGMPHVKMITYDSELDFVSDVPRIIKDGYSLFSSDIKATEQTLREFFPNKFQRRHLLSYPVGQYIYKLHSMWNTKSEQLELCVDDLQVCFASGWVIVDDKNGQDYTKCLEELRVFVSDCRTFNDWDSRLSLLQEIQQGVLAPFEAHIKDMPPEHQRYHRLMADPFQNFSCFTFSNEELDALIALIRKLMDTAQELFSGHDAVDIKHHLELIRKIITSGRNTRLLLKEETAILDELVSRLSPHSVLSQSTCLPGEMAEAIMLIIGGGILDEESFTIQSSHDSDFVNAMYQLESFPITGSGKLHLCFADEARLPGRKQRYVWPLVDAMLDRLSVDEDIHTRRYLNDMRHIISAAPLSHRYLFYSLLQNESVELSWINQQDGKNVAPTPYIQLLEDFFSLVPTEYQRDHLSSERISGLPAVSCTTDLSIKYDAELPDELFKDFVLCPWRYIYSYITDVSPSFITDFHYNFAISNLIGALSIHSDKDKKTIAAQVFPIFPFLRKIEQRQIFDFVSQSTTKGSDSLDNVSYPKDRLKIHFSNSGLANRAQSALKEALDVSTTLSAKFDEHSDRFVCTYCPFNTRCTHVTIDAPGVFKND